MPATRRKKSVKSKRHKTQVAPGNPARRGLPAPENVRAIEDFVSPQGTKYQIIKTTEKDAYDPRETKSGKRKKG